MDHEQKKSFEKLIKAVKSPPVSALPENGITYRVDTDYSFYQLGAAVFQTDKDDIRRPVGYWSRTLNVNERKGTE